MRRRYTARQRAQLIEAVRTSGEPVQAVAERLGVTASTAYLWVKSARAAKLPRFARLVRESRVTSASLVLRVGGAAIRLVGCWAHCRRYFFEAAICKYPIGVQGLMRIRAIYAADDAFRRMPPAKRKLMRAEHIRPLMESFFEWVDQARAAAHGRGLATKALGYAFNQKQQLLRVLEDGAVLQTHSPGAYTARPLACVLGGLR